MQGHTTHKGKAQGDLEFGWLKGGWVDQWLELCNSNSLLSISDTSELYRQQRLGITQYAKTLQFGHSRRVAVGPVHMWAAACSVLVGVVCGSGCAPLWSVEEVAGAGMQGAPSRTLTHAHDTHTTPGMHIVTHTLVVHHVTAEAHSQPPRLSPEPWLVHVAFPQSRTISHPPARSTPPPTCAPAPPQHDANAQIAVFSRTV
jgi:hypothetical protein